MTEKKFSMLWCCWGEPPLHSTEWEITPHEVKRSLDAKLRLATGKDYLFVWLALDPKPRDSEFMIRILVDYIETHHLKTARRGGVIYGLNILPTRPDSFRKNGIEYTYCFAKARAS